MRSTRLGDATWPDLDRDHPGGAILVVPVGSTEQHGPHLPFSTDTDIAQALCNRLAAARDDVVVSPPLPFGSSGEHAGFPGTLSIGQAATEQVLVELGRSARLTFAHLVLVSAHGGNNGPVQRAARTLVAESSHLLVHQPRWTGDPHAGHEETALMLSLRPELVRMHLAVAGDRRPMAQTWSTLTNDGVRAVSENGVLGDPTRATASAGARLLWELVAALLDAVAAWMPPVPAAAAQ